MSNESPRSLSKTQLDKLGDRLRTGTADEGDLRALDEYRRSFRAAYDEVLDTVDNALGVKASGRPAKTTSAIVAKLGRQRIRLSQIQDIAGMRILVDGLREQSKITEELQGLFPGASTDDRRITPSYGYRAVHLVVPLAQRVVEIQVRTKEQHLWAEISQKLADTIDPALKYGGGPDRIQRRLLAFSNVLALIEPIEEKLLALEKRLPEHSSQTVENDVAKGSEMINAQEEYEERWAALERLKEEFARMVEAFFNEFTDRP